MRRPFGTIVFLFNVFICFRLFRLEYSQFMGSIEAAYIGISRHILTSPDPFGWWPAWYGGIPFHNSYPPLLHYLVAAASAVFQVSVARAHHMVSAFFFCLGPAAAYWMAARITGRKLESFVAALLYSVVTPSAWLAPVIAADMHGAWNSRRLQALVVYGEGPHITSMALLPLGLLLFHVAREKKRPAWYLLAALGMAAVTLSNWLGAVALAALMVAYLLPAGNPRKEWPRAALVGIAAYLIASPFIPPSAIAVIRMNATTVVADYTSAGAHLLWVSPFLAAALYFMRKVSPFAIFAVLMAILTLSQFWFGFALMPQPERYHLEMDLGIVFAAVLAAALYIPKRARPAVFWALMIFCAWRGWRLHHYGRELIQPVDITKTIEYRSADWYAKNMPGERVMAPGSVEFWLQAFGEQPQFGGGFLQGDINWENRVGGFFIGALPDGPGAVLWLRAFGIHAVQVSGPLSTEVFKAFPYPHKFDGILDVAWKSGDDTIYRVPGDSIAHVVDKNSLVAKPPYNGLDLEQIRRYVGALDHPARFTWLGDSAARIEAHMRAGQVISIQENYFRGWHARGAKVFADGLGMIALETDCAGDCRVDLFYDGGVEAKLAACACLLTLTAGLVWIVVFRRYEGRKLRSTG